MVGEWTRRDPELDVSPFEVVGRLLLCADHCHRAIASVLRTLGLSYGDFDVINTLRRRGDPQGTNPRELARSSLITSGAMTSRLDRLEQAGLIARSADPADRRGVLVRLTGQGESLAEQAVRAVLEVDEAFLEPLGRRQRDTVAAALKQLLVRYEPG
ncbi:MarR family transcriptional regulator [Plantactinospora endophytica]|uniref:MarR family transcriptional regulator n=2 Tax=Plantactinospora endophytica TaxID=673535 RepID=A0ABQ4EES7_9ACTN|nr:MarR family transcriptional regulator [Plantactinospora endophytica]